MNMETKRIPEEQEKKLNYQTLNDTYRNSLLGDMGLAALFCRQAALDGQVLNEMGERGVMILVSIYDSIVEPEEAMELGVPDDLNQTADFLVLLTAALIRMPLHGPAALFMYMNIDYMVLQFLTDEWFE